jgi:hypothetical protein
MSPLQQLKRALVCILLELAGIYSLDLNLNRESADVDVKRAFRRVIVRVHPDKGGSERATKRLNEAWSKWLEANAAKQTAARPPARPPVRRPPVHPSALPPSARPPAHPSAVRPSARPPVRPSGRPPARPAARPPARPPASFARPAARPSVRPSPRPPTPPARPPVSFEARPKSGDAARKIPHRRDESSLEIRMLKIPLPPVES